MSTKIAIVPLPAVEELDCVGPWEVFSLPRSMRPKACEVFTLSAEGGEVRCAKGLSMPADYSFATAPEADVILATG